MISKTSSRHQQLINSRGPVLSRILGNLKQSMMRIFAGLSVVLFSTSYVFASIQVELNDIGDVSQIQFSGKSNWIYDVKREDKYIEIEIDSLAKEAKSKLTSYQSTQVQKIDIEKKSEERDLVKVYVASTKIDSFDYQMEDPSRLIIDIFVDTNKKVSPKKQVAKKVSDKRKLASELPIKVEEDKPTENKAVAGTSSLENLDDATLGNFDGGDPNFDRFKLEDYEIKESALIASKRNIYIQFPFLIQRNEILEKILKNPPIYEVKSHDSDETKQVLLLKQLFEEQKFAVFITTFKFFKEKYPTSKYDQIVRYMEADTFYSLWLRDRQGVDQQKAIALYESLLKDFPKSPLSERTRLLIAYTYYDAGDKFGALKSFIRMLNEDSNTKYKDDLRISIGDTYRDINKYQDALDTYNVIYLDSKAGNKRIEAKYKVGDVYASKKEFKKAIEAYQEALKEFPEQAKFFPNAFYNIAESQFWLGNYRESLDSYTSYLKNYPKSAHGGFALTRIGEILQILGADEKKYKGAFLESWFRFRGTEGANIARIRYLSELLPKMKSKAAEAAHLETESYVSQSKLPFMKDFSTIVLSDGYYKRGELDKALFMLEDFYRNNSTATTLDLFKDRIVKNLTRQVEKKLGEGKYIEAMRTYGKNAGNWLRDNDRVDLKFFIGQSFENLGANQEAINIYKATINRLYALKGTQEEKERKIFEKFPDIDQLNLRLGKAYLATDNLEESDKYLSKVPKDSSELSKEEKIERVVVQSYLDEKKGRFSEAISGIKQLLENWRAEPELVVVPLMRLASLYERTGKSAQAIVQLDKIINLQEDTKLVNPDLLSKAKHLKADLLLGTDKLEEAASMYSEILTTSKSEESLGDIRYRLGDIYFRQGKLKLAKETWDKLSESTSGSTWYKMAQEKMKDKEWTEQYDKYLSRMPAGKP